MTSTKAIASTRSCISALLSLTIRAVSTNSGTQFLGLFILALEEQSHKFLPLLFHRLFGEAWKTPVVEDRC